VIAAVVCRDLSNSIPSTTIRHLAFLIVHPQRPASNQRAPRFTS
jgi:hypothetical protein